MIPTETVRLRLADIGLHKTIPVTDKVQFCRDFNEWFEGGSCMVFLNLPHRQELCFTRPLSQAWWEQWQRE